MFFGPPCGRNPVARQQPGMDGPQPAGPRQLRFPADRLPRPVRVRLAGSRRRLLPANPAADRDAKSAGARTLAISDSRLRIEDRIRIPIRNRNPNSMTHACNAATPLALAPSLGLAVGVRDVSAGVVGRVRHGDRLGDGVPDWLTSDGVFMPLYPWLSSAGDMFIEHGHRLLGMLAGLLTIALVDRRCASREPRRWVRWFGVGAARWASSLRACSAACACCSTSARARPDPRLHRPAVLRRRRRMVAVTSRRWLNATPPTRAAERRQSCSASRSLTAVLAYLQLVVGAVVRHSPLMLTEGAAAIFQIAVYFHVVLAAGGHVPRAAARRTSASGGRVSRALSAAPRRCWSACNCCWASRPGW